MGKGNNNKSFLGRRFGRSGSRGCFTLSCMFGRLKALCSKFIAPRSAIYRAICECLEAIGNVTDANECFRQMVDELVEQANVHDEQVVWALGE